MGHIYEKCITLNASPGQVIQQNISLESANYIVILGTVLLNGEPYTKGATVNLINTDNSVAPPVASIIQTKLSNSNGKFNFVYTPQTNHSYSLTASTGIIDD